MMNEFQKRLFDSMSSGSYLREDSLGDIKKQIDEFAHIQDELDTFNEVVKKLKKEQKDIAEIIEPVLETLKDRTAETENAIVILKKASHERINSSYKDAFELSLTKVNKATRKILEEALQETQKVSRVAASFESSLKEAEQASIYYGQNLNEGIMDTIKKFMSKVKGIFKNLYSKAKSLSSETKELQQIAKKATS